MEQIIEEWRPIDVPGYLISNTGNMRSIKKCKTSLTTFLSKSGYKQTTICGENWKDGYTNVWIHKLVAKTFIPNPENKNDIKHKNNDTLDNRVENLEWFNSKGFDHRRKYDVNEHYFDEIDTEAKAYFLGLLYADGYNFEPKGYINLGLIEGDRAILERFRKELGLERPLQFIRAGSPSHQNQYRLVINSLIMSKALAQKGCYQGKSLTLKFPEWLQKDLLPHFIRGYFDGDGCISSGYYGRNHDNFRVTALLTSSEKFCKSLQIMFDSILGIQGKCYPGQKSKPEKIWSIYIKNKQQVQLFMDWIYKDSTIYLQRKWDKYQQIKETLKRINFSNQ